MSAKKTRNQGMSEGVIPDLHDVASEPANAERADRLKSAMRAADLTWRALSERADVPFGTLQNYLAGGEMKLSNAVALARALGVRLDWLATGAEPMRIDEPATEAPLDIDVSSLAGMLEAVEKGMPDARPKERLEAALLVHEALRRQVRSLPALDIDVELLAGCLTLIEELARLRGRPRGTAYNRVKAALGAYRHYIAEEAENPSSEASDSV